MTDPRKARTREHVLRAAGRVLAQRTGEPLTFSALAIEARVSRRTLYVHWGTIDALIRDLVELGRPAPIAEPVGATPRQILRSLLTQVRSSLADPVNAVALPALLHDATQMDESAALVARGEELAVEKFKLLLGPTSVDQYARLVGPLYFAQFVGRAPASDALLDALVDQGVEMLGLVDDGVAA